MKTKSRDTIAMVSWRSSRRIVMAAVVLLVAVTKTSAAPALGGTDKAMVSTYTLIN